jgi:hypothetical protein
MLWRVAWDQWEHRNGILHNQDNLVRKEEERLLDLRVTTAYQDYQNILPITDHHFFTLSLQDLLKRKFRFKLTWLNQITVAKGRAARAQLYRSRLSTYVTLWRHRRRLRQVSIFSMRQRMRQWLRLSR